MMGGGCFDSVGDAVSLIADDKRDVSGEVRVELRDAAAGGGADDGLAHLS